MRIDKFLKVSRLIKRRTVAASAANAGRITVNGKEAKASTDIKVGDIIEIRFGSNLVKAQICKIANQAGKNDAEEMYKIIEEN